MTWPQNSRYLMRLNSAADSRQRPTAALMELDDPFTGWTSMDYRLQEAIYTLNKDICSCGNPVWLCHSTDGRIEFEIQTKACYARGEIETFEKDARNAIPLEPGEYRVAVAVGLENEDGTRDPLPSRREAMEQM